MTRRQLLASAIAAPVAAKARGTIDAGGGVIVPANLFYVEDIGRGIYAVDLDEKEIIRYRPPAPTPRTRQETPAANG